MQSSPATQTVTGKTDGSLLRSKLSNILLGLIIFFSATQLGLHFWPLSSLVYGIRIDYLSPTIYFLDLLMILFLLQRTVLNGIIVSLLPALIVNLLYSQNPLATLSWSLHFLLYFVFLRSVLVPGSDLLRKSWLSAKMFSRTSKTSSETRSDPQSKFKNLRIYDLRLILPLALLFQLLLALAQVYLGHSVGGLMYYLGERSVAVGQPAVALGTFMDTVVLRAYGTFGHPNVLAGWSVACLLILIQISQTAIPKVSKQRVVRGSDPLRKSWLPAKMFSRLQNAIRRPGQTLWVLTVISIVLLTQSRAAYLALFGLVIPFYLIKKLNIRFLYFFVSLLVCWFFYPALLSPPRSDLSLSERRTLQGLSLSVVRAFPLFGTGAQASISTYPTVTPENRLLQPDHNTFTLFLSWFGLFGVLAILYSMRSFILHSPFSILPLVPLLALDHYFLTSPQGLFILLSYIQVALNYSHAQKNL